jgi:hypothetical protein
MSYLRRLVETSRNLGTQKPKTERPIYKTQIKSSPDNSWKNIQIEFEFKCKHFAALRAGSKGFILTYWYSSIRQAPAPSLAKPALGRVADSVKVSISYRRSLSSSYDYLQCCPLFFIMRQCVLRVRTRSVHHKEQLRQHGPFYVLWCPQSSDASLPLHFQWPEKWRDCCAAMGQSSEWHPNLISDTMCEARVQRFLDTLSRTLFQPKPRPPEPETPTHTQKVVLQRTELSCCRASHPINAL